MKTNPVKILRHSKDYIRLQVRFIETYHRLTRLFEIVHQNLARLQLYPSVINRQLIVAQGDQLSCCFVRVVRDKLEPNLPPRALCVHAHVIAHVHPFTHPRHRP